MQKYAPIPFEINLRPEGFIIDVGSLFEALLGLHDQRDVRGVRHALVTVLVFVVLAKFAGEDWLRGIAQWVAERKVGLAEFFGLAKPQAPCYTTNARILGRAGVIDEFEQVVHGFLWRYPAQVTRWSLPSTAKPCAEQFRWVTRVACIYSPPIFLAKVSCSCKWRWNAARMKSLPHRVC
jgi:hypothetical protein